MMDNLDFNTTITPITNATLDGTPKIILLEEQSGGTAVLPDGGSLNDVDIFNYWSLPTPTAAQLGVNYFFAAKPVRNLSIDNPFPSSSSQASFRTNVLSISDLMESAEDRDTDYIVLTQGGNGIDFKEKYPNTGTAFTVNTSSVLYHVVSVGSNWYLRKCGEAIQKP